MIITSLDWLQTKEIARNVNYKEANPILGEYPTQEMVDISIASAIIAHAVIAYYLPEKYRRVWQVVWVIIEVGAVSHNFNAGVKINF